MHSHSISILPKPPAWHKKPKPQEKKNEVDHSIHLFLEETRGITFGDSLADGKFYAVIGCSATSQTYTTQVSPLKGGKGVLVDSGHCWKIFADTLKGFITIAIFEKGILPWGSFYGKLTIPLDVLKDKPEVEQWVAVEPDPVTKKNLGSPNYIIVSGEMKVRLVNNIPPEKIEKHRRHRKKHKERKKRGVRDFYEFGQVLGRGAHGVVRLVTEKGSKQRVFACKVLSKNSMDDAEIDVIHGEVRLHKTLQHENIIRLHEAFETSNHVYIIMELVDGGELFDLVSERGFLGEDEAALIINQLVHAVAYMHDHGVVHRDLKPENILCTRAERPVIKIIDFGASKTAKGDDRLKTFVGTPSYLSPEVIQGKPYDSSVDVWAIGVIAYIVLSGFQPFEGDSMAETMLNILGCKYTMEVPEFDPVSDEAKDFIKCIFKPNPAERPTAKQLLEHVWLVPFNSPESAGHKAPSLRKLASIGHIKARQTVRRQEIAKRAANAQDDVESST